MRWQGKELGDAGHASSLGRYLLDVKLQCRLRRITASQVLLRLHTPPAGLIMLGRPASLCCSGMPMSMACASLPFSFPYLVQFLGVSNSEHNVGLIKARGSCMNRQLFLTHVPGLCSHDGHVHQCPSGFQQGGDSGYAVPVTGKAREHQERS